ncbi:hypothetical protein CHS0354_003232 [Potamilus streckersoni]|uniref:Uncharacterized protein n=1 Tax=Potamilus streckersoni TaxID=2493646 RepID=A0AAE0SJ95_9BIVA|nr:hypothetical protein CHS0354_003232 [Potamilus streckersoni]
MKLELLFVSIGMFLTLKYTNGQQHIQSSGIIGRFAGGSLRSSGGSSFGGQRVNSTARSSSTVGQVGLSGSLGGQSGFDPSLTSLVGWAPFGGVFGGGFGGGGVISTNVRNINEVWGRGNFNNGIELGGARTDGSDIFDSGFAGRFRQFDNTVNSGLAARFRQIYNVQGLPGASAFRRSGGSFTDTGPYYNHKVNYGYQTNDDYDTKYASDYKKGHGEKGYDNYYGYDDKKGYEKKGYSDYNYDIKEYDHQKGKYDYKEDGRYYDGNIGNDRKEYDYKGTGKDGHNSYYQGNNRYQNKGYSNYHNGYNKNGYNNKEYDNNNPYRESDKKGYSGSGYHGNDGYRRDGQGDNDRWHQDKNGYSSHHRYRDERGQEYDEYRDNRYHAHEHSRRGRHDNHDDRQHRDNSGYYKKQYDSYRHEPRYYGAGTKTYEDHGHNNASNDYRFKGQYLYGIFRDRSQGFRYGPNSGNRY